tara:strand:- start:2644 stop:2853 length:210 start_codon:yes stop_codon:yes gene_type:complete
MCKMVITQTSFGIYVIEDGELLTAEDYKDIEADNWVQVDDLTCLSEKQYKNLEFMLRLNYGYKMNGRFL